MRIRLFIIWLFLQSYQLGNHGAVSAPVLEIFFIQLAARVRQVVIPPARARVFVSPIRLNDARALQPSERGIQRRLLERKLAAGDLLHVLADDIAVAVAARKLRKNDRVRLAAKDIR